MTSTPATQTLSSTDEISLLELWQILVRRRRWMIITLGVCLAAGLAYALLKAPLYEASVKLRIGQVAGSGLFEPAEELSARLLAQYGENVADGVKRERPFLARAAAQKNVVATVELVAEGDRPEDAVALLNRIFEGVQKSHFQNYTQNVQFLTERLQNLDKQRQAFQQQYEDTTAMLERLAQRDPVQASLIMLERGRVSAAMNALDAEKPGLVQKLTRPLTQPTELMGEITAPTKPAKPKRALVVALSAVLGLMGGVMLAFVAEFVAKARDVKR
jgi:uncharacterized protein involved in exopolysaccharide biosynthesis